MLPLIIIIVYFIAMIALGLSTRKQAKNAGSFFVAGRSGSTLFITGSLLATIIGASATMGMAGMGFSLRSDRSMVDTVRQCRSYSSGFSFCP